jgi:hypothetical protein
VSEQNKKPLGIPPFFLAVGIVCAWFALMAIEGYSQDLGGWVRIFPVGIHEMGHAYGCVLTGGHVGGMIILPFEHASGETWTAGGWNFLYTQTGYMGVSAFACLLLWLTSMPHRARAVLIVVGVFFALSGLYFMGAPAHSNLNATHLATVGYNAWWSRIVAVLLGSLFAVAGWRMGPRVAYCLLVGVAVWLAASSEVSLVGLTHVGSFIRGEPTNDAAAMQADYYIPAFVWSYGWLIVTNIMFAGTLYLMQRRRSQDDAA